MVQKGAQVQANECKHPAEVPLSTSDVFLLLSYYEID